MGKISAVYKIVNTVTGEFYIGSSVDVKQRWVEHKCPSTWKRHPKSPLYQDMQEYGLDKFRFQMLAPVMPEYLKQVEQELIELLKPTYNDRNSNGLDVERHKATNKKYEQSEKGRATHKESNKKYEQSEKGRATRKKYCQSEKGRATCKKVRKKYNHQLCEYNGETLTLGALSSRFYRAGISHPNIEARKYLISK